jgi:hypothetical protein
MLITKRRHETIKVKAVHTIKNRFVERRVFTILTNLVCIILLLIKPYVNGEMKNR